jgi:probable F420-dependent oxidoreductase
MKFGTSIPTGQAGANPDAIREFAQEAEQIGLASVWLSDSLLRPTDQPIDFGNGMSITTPAESAHIYAPLETLSYLAAVTSRIGLGTSTLISLFQNPVSMARRLATLDQLSDGRLLAGLGQGWVPQEFVAAGIPPKRRGAGFAEHITAMRAVWGPDPVRFDGRFYQIPEAQIGPKPVRPDGPRVLIGAAAPAGFERAGAMGLGLLPIMFGWEPLAGQLMAYRTAATDAGHDPAKLPVVLMVNGTVTEKSVDDAGPLTGSPAQIAEQLPRLTELGIDHVIWNMIGTPPDAQLAAMRALLQAT